MFRRCRPTPVETRPQTTSFVCSSCGRSDLPETGGWTPPICLECDAAINFDADLELLAMHEDGGDDGEPDDDEENGPF